MAKAKQPVKKGQKSLITLKGEPVWLEWLERYAEFLGLQVSTTIDVALRKQAIEDGFDDPMPKRFTR
jgi:hypothetical protein